MPELDTLKVIKMVNGILDVTVVQLLSCVRFSMTPWAVAHQAPLPMEFSREEYWVAISFCRRFSRPRDQTHISYISR